MEKFRQLGMSSEILQSLEELKFTEPTEIQEKTIPLVIAGKDVIAGASTGSGKTLAFGTGIIQNSTRQGVVQALVLVPTRELADQVAKNLRTFAKHKHLDIVDVYGGVSMSPQVQKLRRADVVVGTPGRILDHLERKTLDLGYVKIVVLDEADRMLDMGFIDDVNRIVGRCPQERQTLLFSATINNDVKRLSDRYMNKPIIIAAESQVDPTKLKQTYYDVPDGLKFSLLVHLIKNDTTGLVMVFCNTQRNTDFVARNLQHIGIRALAIHGGHSQEKRTRTMDQFHSKDVQVLVCTDVAARGLDIKGVSHVYNYDIPIEPNQYVHRIGRTARAGTEGKAVNILASRDYDNFTRVLRENRGMTKEELPENIEKVSIVREERGGFGRSRFGGGRSFGGRSEGGFSRGRSFGRSEGGFSRGRSSEGSDDQGSTGGYNRRRMTGGDGRGASRGGRFGGGRGERRFSRHSRRF